MLGNLELFLKVLSVTSLVLFLVLLLWQHDVAILYKGEVNEFTGFENVVDLPVTSEAVKGCLDILVVDIKFVTIRLENLLVLLCLWVCSFTPATEHATLILRRVELNLHERLLSFVCEAYLNLGVRDRRILILFEIRADKVKVSSGQRKEPIHFVILHKAHEVNLLVKKNTQVSKH